MMYDLKILTDSLDQLNIEYDDKKIDALIKYFEMLIEKNKVMNLTAITEFSDVMIKHFADSLAVLKYIDFPENSKIMDLGTGAGFPGIPLKIFRPDLDLLLVDSVNKKLNFIKEVVDELHLEKIKVLHGRAEDLGHDSLYREKFDFLVSRAVANLSTLSEYSLPFVKKGGYFISYKASIVKEELNAAEKAISILGGQFERNEKFNLPYIEDERNLVFILKRSNTPGKYPRKSGIPSKEPL